MSEERESSGNRCEIRVEQDASCSVHLLTTRGASSVYGLTVESSVRVKDAIERAYLAGFAEAREKIVYAVELIPKPTLGLGYQSKS